MSKKSKSNCVFCGKQPEGQNKEHVIPKWLMKLTGDENRFAYFGRNKNDGKFIAPIANMEDILSKEKSNLHRTYRFSSFQFPACKICNDEFAVLEGNTKPIVENLIKNNTLIKEDVPILLDWLDKVRVGTWLGNLQLDKNGHDIKPNFAIKQRMGASDRVLMIKRIEGFDDGINLIGTDTYAFYSTPSVFGLRINEYILFNMSSVFIVSKELGFPYYESSEYNYNTGKVGVAMIRGTEGLKKPLPYIDAKNMSVKLYQPIFDAKAIDEEGLYKSNYVRNNSLDYENGKGDIFIGDDSIRPMRKKEKITFSKCDDLYPFYSEELLAIDVLGWQSWVVHDFFSRIDLSKLTKEQKENMSEQYNSAIKLNEKYIKKVSKLNFQKSMGLMSALKDMEGG